MKLIRLSWHDKDEGTCYEWHSSKDAASKARTQKRNKYHEPKLGEIESVEVPTDKTGLVAWLNRHFIRDNG